MMGKEERGAASPNEAADAASPAILASAALVPPPQEQSATLGANAVEKAGDEEVKENAPFDYSTLIFRLLLQAFIIWQIQQWWSNRTFFLLTTSHDIYPLKAPHTDRSEPRR